MGHIEKLVFDRGTSRINHKNDHDVTSVSYHPGKTLDQPEWCSERLLRMVPGADHHCSHLALPGDTAGIPSSPILLVTSGDSPVSAARLILMYPPSIRFTSAETTSPNFICQPRVLHSMDSSTSVAVISSYCDFVG